MAVERRSLTGRIEQLGSPADVTRAKLRIGGAVVISLLVLIGAVLIGIAIFAWLTYPSANEITASLPDKKGLREAIQDDRVAWFNQIKDLLQLLVVSLLVPALTTILGYIFGKEQAEG